MLLRMTTLLLVSSSLMVTVPAKHKPNVVLDAVWVRQYGISGRPSAKGETRGRGDDLRWDSRFAPLLRSAFPQRQWFWRDHGHFSSTASMVSYLLSIPNDALLDENRYLSVEGCLVHVCDLRSLLWIDSAPHPLLIFSTSQFTSSDDHLLMFSSAELNFTKLPPPFLDSLRRWFAHNQALGYARKIGLVTLVQPDGLMQDFYLSDLKIADVPTGAKP